MEKLNKLQRKEAQLEKVNETIRKNQTLRAKLEQDIKELRLSEIYGLIEEHHVSLDELKHILKTTKIKE